MLICMEIIMAVSINKIIDEVSVRKIVLCKGEGPCVFFHGINLVG